MKESLTIVVMITTLLLLTACSNTDKNPFYQSSSQLPRFGQESFEHYLKDTRQWLYENRVFHTRDKARELYFNMPFELKPEHPNGEGALLVQGLGDSPYSFRDIAEHLVRRGYLVRTILLPGHGSKPGDLKLPTVKDWQSIVAHHAKLLGKAVKTVWLGGYSTGANLVTDYALNHSSIAGLLLFSPAFQPGSDKVKYAPIANYFIEWADKDEETNIARYDSLPMNGAAVYYQTAQAVDRTLQKLSSYNKPVFIMVSEADSVIDTQFVLDTFIHKMTNPNNRLLWFGEGSFADPRIIQYTMNLPENKISNASHMALLFSPENTFYGSSGTQRICGNGQEDWATQRCKSGGDIWFSAWGYREPGKAYARLTWNPYFNASMTLMDGVLSHSLPE
ncbi:alpha/beta hydrolase [Candidatus Sororendozoicomonas aggregata]|uniref:alpha/beta hydrolase n=1 Tax=Candidatus Sororendozoicomonas aggregata TaxID=3073239 RepID=UPI002ED0804D